jgi:hypothetical protein
MLELFLPFKFFACFYFSEEIKTIFKKINKNDSILFWDLPSRIAIAIAKIIKTKKRYGWIWNTLRNQKLQILLLKKYCKIYTFDIRDYVKYKIYYKNQVYCQKRIINTPPPPP